MCIKILHCVVDEKFIDGAIELFDSIEGYKNEYVIIDSQNKNLEYIKSEIVKQEDEAWYIENCIVNNNFNIVILHNLISLNSELIYRTNSMIKVIWLSWGFDLYELPMPITPLINLTNQIKGNYIRIFENYVVKRIKRTISEIIIHQFKNVVRWRNVLKRIDYYSGVFLEEFDLLIRDRRFNAKKIQYNYVSRKSPLKIENIEKYNIDGRRNIIIGHQANPLLNHENTFKRIKRLNISSDIDIICPMSYGPETEIKRILELGSNMFGKNFIPLLDFMPYDQYLKVYDSVNVAIFNIERQCAVGNIILAIWDGVKVFLPKSSLNYRHFINLGIRVYSIEDELNLNNIKENASREEVKENRKLLLENYSFDSVRTKLTNSLKLIEKNICKRPSPK